ncbi:MAG TPA: hypothetical protein VM695_14375 [Phycisphaerae bacterium]|nr:hypothetical protein [Phycisphaerae bacterium]
MSDASDGEDVLVPVPWYKPSEWERLEEIAPDLKQRYESYEQWHAGMTRAMDRLRRDGKTPVKVEIEVEDLLAWCRTAGRPVDSAARAEYAAAKLQEEQGG